MGGKARQLEICDADTFLPSFRTLPVKSDFTSGMHFMQAEILIISMCAKHKFGWIIKLLLTNCCQLKLSWGVMGWISKWPPLNGPHPDSN